MVTVQAISQFFATLACGLFAGASIYINLVEHPARLECGTELAATVFGPSYRRAAVIQNPLAAFGFVFALVAWFTSGSLAWLIGGVVLVSVIPITLLVIRPTNRELLTSTLDRSSSRTRELLLRWGRLHALRSAFSFVALSIFLFSA